MESPQHDAWQPDRHSDKKTAKKRCNELYKWIKETIQNLGRSSASDVMDAEGVGEFLPDNVATVDIQNQSTSFSL